MNPINSYDNNLIDTVIEFVPGQEPKEKNEDEADDNN